MIFKFNKELYNRTALFKAAYKFTDRAYIHLDVDEQYFVVEVTFKDEKFIFDEKEFSNAILTQMVRQHISNQTKSIRELVMARAFASTLVEKNPNISNDTSDYNIDDILMDWFEKNG